MLTESQTAATQEWNASRYAANARFVSDLGQPVLDLLSPQAGERILDLGCGDGALTEKLIAAGAEVVGVDASADMVAAARKRGIDGRVMDAYQLEFRAEFDAVLSNAAMHWMKRDPDAVIAGVRRALKPGGRFASEMGGHGCVAAIVVALCATTEKYGIGESARLIPWYFPHSCRLPHAARTRRLHRRIDRFDSAPNASANRNAHMAGNLRNSLYQERARTKSRSFS
jgi:SAM-dependent methyltransferase